ncbi:MAG: DUF4982 domain-containing protein [Gemmatimonadaceae bacterium]|nr:DUF4982 domain-containing protein [Gemmatimonadaceae bacterium]
MKHILRRALLAALSATLAIHAAPARAQSPAGSPRVSYRIDADWLFFPDGVQFAEKPSFPDSAWSAISLPHTWNSLDPFDDQPGYRRGIGWYRKHLALPGSLKGKRIFLQFEGVNQVAVVYVNGAFVGEHKGGYTGFTIDITDQLRFDGAANSNVIAVQVDNSHNPFIPPLSVGFALYGGIYRNVSLIATDPVHVAFSDYGATEVYASTPSASGVVMLHGSVRNDGASERAVAIRNSLHDARGTSVAEHGIRITVQAGASVQWEDTLRAISRPRLWSPDNPYLYTIRTDLSQGELVFDRVESRVGFRWYEFDPQRGFLLNGKKLLLRGTNRHQDYQGLGSALSDSLHERDMRSIKDMGANFVRLAHYPQDPAVLAAADSLGLLIWEEIPVVNYVTPGPEFAANAVRMLKEMIQQHFNHPSLIMWGMMNEVFLWSPEGFRIRKQADARYMESVRRFASLLDSVARADDPTRVTTMAVHGSGDYDTSGVSRITGVLGQNIYSGWYSGLFEDFGKQLDRRHAARPSEIMFVSEYGAEDDARVNSLAPERFDFSGTWMRRFHESYLRQINSRSWLAGTAVWSQFDFSQPETGGSIPYMNQKGLETWDRTPKDAYYLYKANWNPAPMVYIASRGWNRRLGLAETQPIDVYSNLPRVELLVNGTSQGVKSPDDVHRATWEVHFASGQNKVAARGVGGTKTVSDRMEIEFTLRPPRLNDAAATVREIAVNVGGKAQYAQPSGPVWEGDQEYRTGDFGYSGGEARIFDKDLAIKDSPDTPLFFTYHSGIVSYRFDLPDGDYDLQLLFAEPDAKPGERIFSVTANGRAVVNDLDLAARYGLARAVIINSGVSAKDGQGIDIKFSTRKGKAILNGIHVRKK